MSRNVPAHADSGQALISEIKGLTLAARWERLRIFLSTKAMADPDARFVRDSLVQIMDMLRPPPKEDLALTEGEDFEVRDPSTPVAMANAGRTVAPGVVVIDPPSKGPEGVS